MDKKPQVETLPVANLAEAHLPKLEDGCVVGTQKCYGETIMCDTCLMPLCEEHMSRTQHLMDCHFRLGLEKKTMKEMQKRHTEELAQAQKKKELEVIDKVYKDIGKVMSYEEIIKEQQKLETEKKHREQKERDRVRAIEKAKVEGNHG